MDTLILVVEILLCLFSVFIVAVVLLQSGKSAGLSGSIAGGAETFLGKSKAKSYDKTLKKLTKISAVGIMILAVGLVLVEVYVMPSVASPAAPTTAVSATPAPLEMPSVSPDITAAP
jgi:preprotein translocase subunit SecG